MTRDLYPLRRVPAVLLVAALAALALDAASPQQSIDLSGDQQVLAFRSAPARRVDVVRGGGYFPVIARLRDGSIAAIVRGGGAHVGVAGRLDLVLSRDTDDVLSARIGRVDIGVKNLFTHPLRFGRPHNRAATFVHLYPSRAGDKRDVRAWRESSWRKALPLQREEGGRQKSSAGWVCPTRL